MRKCLLTAVVSCVFFMNCDSAKRNETDAGELEKLNGSWQLNFISESKTVFEDLYPGKKPTISFVVRENVVYGNNSCNSYSGKLHISGNKISFKEPMAVTRMMCGDGKSETVYMETLRKVESYSVSKDGKTMKLKKGKTVLMLFEREQSSKIPTAPM